MDKDDRNLLKPKNWPVLFALIILVVWILGMGSQNPEGVFLRLAETMPAFLLIALVGYLVNKIKNRFKKK